MLASASRGVILAFNVRPVGEARQVAEREGVEIRSYSVIYRAIEELRAAMQGMLEPEEVETTLGQAEIRQLFRASRIGTIAGVYVKEGKITRGASVRVVREGTVIDDTTVASLRRFDEDVREVSAGYECGIVLANFQDLREGDILETYETRRQSASSSPREPKDRRDALSSSLMCQAHYVGWVGLQFRASLDPRLSRGALHRLAAATAGRRDRMSAGRMRRVDEAIRQVIGEASMES